MDSNRGWTEHVAWPGRDTMPSRPIAPPPIPFGPGLSPEHWWALSGAPTNGYSTQATSAWAQMFLPSGPGSNWWANIVPSAVESDSAATTTPFSQPGVASPLSAASSVFFTPPTSPMDQYNPEQETRGVYLPSGIVYGAPRPEEVIEGSMTTMQLNEPTNKTFQPIDEYDDDSVNNGDDEKDGRDDNESDIESDNESDNGSRSDEQGDIAEDGDDVQAMEARSAEIVAWMEGEVTMVGQELVDDDPEVVSEGDLLNASTPADPHNGLVDDSDDPWELPTDDEDDDIPVVEDEDLSHEQVDQDQEISGTIPVEQLAELKEALAESLPESRPLTTIAQNRDNGEGGETVQQDVTEYVNCGDDRSGEANHGPNTAPPGSGNETMATLNDDHQGALEANVDVAAFDDVLDAVDNALKHHESVSHE